MFTALLESWQLLDIACGQLRLRKAEAALLLGIHLIKTLNRKLKTHHTPLIHSRTKYPARGQNSYAFASFPSDSSSGSESYLMLFTAFLTISYKVHPNSVLLKAILARALPFQNQTRA